jgi:hypothetical protein
MATAVKKQVDENSLTQILERLSKEFRLPKVENKCGMTERQGNTYLIGQHPNGGDLIYKDCTVLVWVHKQERSISYTVKTCYLDAKVDLLKKSGIKIGETLAGEFEAMIKAGIKKHGIPDVCARVGLHDSGFSEVYKFIEYHIKH